MDTEKQTAPSAPESPSVPEKSPPASSGLKNLLRPMSIALVIALGLLAWQWVETRARFETVQQALASRLAESDSTTKEVRKTAEQNQESMQVLGAKIALLEAKLAESQSQQAALESLYQELARAGDERLLAELEQMISLASQQLQIAGNVEAALIALQAAESRLERAHRAQFLSLRNAIAKDIERLGALPMADLPGIAGQLESVMTAVDGLPLTYEAKPKMVATVSEDNNAPLMGFWKQLGAELWHELRQLVRIERVDHPEPVLLAPEHAFFLRENLKLRLMNARLALLQRDGESFRDDIEQSEKWLHRFFEVRDSRVNSALAMLKQISGATLKLETPSLQDSLNAVRNFKLSRESQSTQPTGKEQ